MGRLFCGDDAFDFFIKNFCLILKVMKLFINKLKLIKRLIDLKICLEMERTLNPNDLIPISRY